MPDVEWTIRPFCGLSPDELYDLLKLRVDVFVVEQNCPYPELDDKDRHPDTRHLTARDRSGYLVAYSRILPPGLCFSRPGIGRVAVVKNSRGRGLCHAMMKNALAYIRDTWPGMGVMISAQVYLEGFYGSHGFETVSAPYLEDGIAHVDMIRKERPAGGA